MTGSGRGSRSRPTLPGATAHAVVVDDGDVVARHRPAHRARPHRHQRRAVGDHEVALGLAVELVDRQPEASRDPSRAARRQGSRRRSRSSAGAGPSRRRRARPPDQLERGRRQEDVPDPVARHEVKRPLGLEPARPVGDAPAGPNARPGTARRTGRRSRPSPPASRTGRPAAARSHAATATPGQVAEEEPVGVERALRRPGRARGVDDDRRVVGGGDGRAMRR